MHPERPSSLVGVAVIRGGGAVPVQWRLPTRSPVSLGARERHGLELAGDWVPKDLAVFTPVEEGWLVANGPRTTMRLETDWVDVGHVQVLPHGILMVQRGEARLTWPGLKKPLAVVLSVRTRRLEDQRIPFAVDRSIEGQPAPGAGSYLGLKDTPMSGAVRYRLAVLFRHLLEGEPEPLHLLRRRAEFLHLSEAELEGIAQRYRRRLNAMRGTDIDNLRELGEYLVTTTGELTRADLDP